MISFFQLASFALGIYLIVKGILAHLAFVKLAEKLSEQFEHYTWDQEHPIQNRKWNDSGEPQNVSESRKLWNKLKSERDSVEVRRNFYFILAVIFLGIFLNGLRSL